VTEASVIAQLTGIAPQFLVDDLGRAIDYYGRCLGFQLDFQYEGFYASVSRDGCAIHLKCAPKTQVDRAHRREQEHLDAYIEVRNVAALHDELRSRGALITKPLEDRPWSCRDFYIQDPDEYILCFSEPTSANPNHESAILELEQRLAAAWVKGDRPFIDRLLADDWTVIDQAGRVLTKRQLLDEAFGSTERRIEAMNVDDVQVRVFNDTAVVTGRTRATGSYREQVATVTLRFTDVLVFLEGRWHIVASQGTTVAP